MADTQLFTFQFDGYTIADRLLEGVIYDVTAEIPTDIDWDECPPLPNKIISVVEHSPNHPYMIQFVDAQRQKWCDLVKQTVEEDNYYLDEAFYGAHC